MGEAVEVLLDKLRQLLLYHPDLIKESEEEVKYLEENLRHVKAFLEDSSGKKQAVDESLLLQIRNFVYDMDDIVDAYVAQIAKHKSKSWCLRFFSKPSTNLLSVDQRGQSLLDQIERYKNFSSFKDEDANSLDDTTEIESYQRNSSFKDNECASLNETTELLKGERKKLIRYLLEESKEIDVITIVGMPGIGKTTLAWKTFISDEVKRKFPIRIWIDVTHKFTEEEVFLSILKHLAPLTDDITNTGSRRDRKRQLARLVATYLEMGKFLIVMDDVWSAHDWDRLRIALPKFSKMGKVLITSCNENVGWYANKSRHPVKVRFLSQSESWLLLRDEVFGHYGHKQYDSELESIGKVIAGLCDGLPLAILAMARTLVKEDLSSSDMGERRIAWAKVGSRVPQYRSSIFYNNLPSHLQLCFLYFGMYPYDHEIPVWKLILMWIAEGFIQKREHISLEETAGSYLESLIDRNLVIVGQIKSNGKPKTCRIHPMLHDFCRGEAANRRISFLQQIKMIDGDFDPPISDLSNYSRLSVISNIMAFLSSKPSGIRVRSFVGFSYHEVHLPPEITIPIPAGFRRLRVLDVMPIKFTNIPSDIYQMIHLKFLALSFDSAILSAKLSKLWNIQTLVLHTTSRTLKIQADIWQFTQLRHLKTNASATFATTAKHSRHGENLQTLGMISPESCTRELFDRARNLKKLGIRGRLSSFLDRKIGSSDCLGRLTCLENLKLLNDVYPLPPSEGRLRRLSSPYTFPPRVRSLTLARTYLDWKEMRILGFLENLEVLKLKDNAFVGRIWEAKDKGFPNLKALHIGRTDLVIWIASPNHFPVLKSLKLYNCEELREVPIELADIPSLQRLELFHTKLAAASAVRIGDEIKIHKHTRGQSRNTKEFKLCIFPFIQ